MKKAVGVPPRYLANSEEPAEMPTPYMRWAGKRFRMRDRMKRKSCWSPTVLNLYTQGRDGGSGENRSEGDTYRHDPADSREVGALYL